MTLKDIINKHQFLSVESELTRLYPDEQGQIEAFWEVYHQLRLMPVEIALKEAFGQEGSNW